jgi:hypothetical protein
MWGTSSLLACSLNHDAGEGTSGPAVRAIGMPLRFETAETARQSEECWTKDPKMIDITFL